jgi:hypothetical protein
MKKLFVILIILLGFTVAKINAQFTKGGTYKNYEKYHVTYDTIKTNRTVTSQGGGMQKVGYMFVNIGPAVPLSKTFMATPTTSTSYYQDFNGMGGLGGSVGFDGAIGGFYGIPGINKHLIPQIDLAVYQSLNFSYLSWSYENLGSPYSSYDYTGFMALSTCIGPAIVFNPVKDLDLHVDVIYRVGVGMTFGGDMEDYGSSILSRDELGATFYHGPIVHFRYSFLLVGFEFSFLGDYGSMRDDSTPSSAYFYNSVPLNNFAFKIGSAF